MSNFCGQFVLSQLRIGPLKEVTTMMTIPAIFSTTQVRFKYFSERKATPLIRRWGYKDRGTYEGLLPRDRALEDIKVKGILDYIPKKNWNEKKSLFGQNDYIDILGPDPTLNPALINYSVPFWLKGFRGNEFQTLVRKRKIFGIGLRRANPDKHHELMKNIKYLYKTLNRKRRVIPVHQN